ncbi:serine/threonine protein kinase [Saprolegnia parasitica CBS 223.65]|uniref:Serine/threonine protein kinase n=1 Tax=Saprolegnia parasitica (strain CBS 223.65) TaxID=695850 RepID=A0A067BTM2_SAPPC|nr:serine/threonine protein kinase [Saprolegnia parasitica CBS 223.65]KDO17997.1 serine/threonine protein kinase [Saprolegnia parasitica CBS 223.65]|eukprot:XP_012211296.1 serine/threonine protein kinase [Saprolegnia parasitica CBS 223.65]
MCFFCKCKCPAADQAGCRTRQFLAGVNDAIATASYTPMSSPKQSTQVPMVSSNELDELESLGASLSCVTAKGVYRSRDVLVKTFRFFGHIDDFGRHVQTYYQLRSPYLVSLLAVADVASARPKLIFEYMDGGSLRDYVSSRKNTMPPVTIALAVAKGLEHLHRHRVAHGRLHLHNILIATDGRIKLAEVGLSYEAALRESLPRVARILKLTIHDPPRPPRNYWMAPKARHSKAAATAAADIFSFGVMMIELMWFATHGNMDFFGKAMLHVHAGTATTDLLEVPDDGYHALALRCVAHDPSTRPTAAEIVQLLQ